MSETLAKLLFGFALLSLTFGYGVLAATQNMFPYPLIQTATTTFQDLRKNWKNDVQLEPTRHLGLARYEGDGVTIRDDDRIQPGTTFLAGMFGEQMGARLVTTDGSLIHEWPVNYTEIWPDHETLVDGEPVSDWNVFLHGALALPDGSIVINFDVGRSLVRLNRCGEVVWKLRDDIHHSVFQAEDGTLWVPYGNDVAQVAQDGEILRRIRVKEMMLKNGLHGALFINDDQALDPHPNDVEVLRAGMAAAFPMFEAGDVVYSMRNLNLLIVFDPDTQVVKWYRHGPWLRQHDPDFLPDGRISVFNNRTGYASSNIMAVEPATNQVEVTYEAEPPGSFYTEIRGKHQPLGNGNLLITEAQRGRVFEVTPSGETVWQYINRYDEDRTLVVADAIRYPPDYFEVDDWSCAS